MTCLVIVDLPINDNRVFEMIDHIMNQISPLPVQSAVSVNEAILSRRSIRMFLPNPVHRDAIERLLQLASHAPSGSNTQPWQVTVVQGKARDALCDEILSRHYAGDFGTDEYRYYPEAWEEPYQSRRRSLGLDLYKLAGVSKGDKEAMSRQLAMNYTFFDAPVGLFFTIPRNHAMAAWIDLGAFMQTFMLAARGMGLDTCGQQAFAKYHDTIARHLGLAADKLLVCGMAIGFADPEAPVNALTTERDPVNSFAQFLWD